MKTVLRIGAFALIVGGASLLSMAGCMAGAEPEPGDAVAGEGGEAALLAKNQQLLSTGIFYYIRAKHSNKCLHQHGATHGSGDSITQWDCIDRPNVQWEFEQSPDPGYYFIKARHSGKCAHQHRATHGNGDPITQWDCVNQGNVKWRLIDAPDNYFYIQAQHSGKCMHVHGGGSENGAHITQWDCINQPNVLWRLDPVGH